MEPEMIEIVNCVKRINNNIWWFGEIDTDVAHELCVALKEAESYCVSLALQHGTQSAINLYINSPGGCVYSAISVVETMRGLSTDVNTHIQGVAASSATLISTSGANRTIGKYSTMLVHQLSAGTAGKHSELQDFLDNTQLTMDMLRRLYKDRTKLPDKKLEALFKSDKLLTPEFCLQYKLVDAIV
jgi:ATP-dependent Clp protease protease subunit